MRMRENWEVWLLPNQATGKQGVPRYIKVDPATVSEEDATTSGVDAAEPGETPEQVKDLRTPVIEPYGNPSLPVPTLPGTAFL